MTKKGNQTTFKAGNQAALKHGAAGAEKALTTGDDFHGPAIVKQVDVEAELAEHGIDHMVLRGAERLQTVADLYYDAIVMGSQQGASIAVLDGFVARWGWIQNSTLRAWAQVQANDAKQGTKTLDAVLSDMEKQLEQPGE